MKINQRIYLYPSGDQSRNDKKKNGHRFFIPMSWLVTFVFSASSTVSLRITTFVLRSTSLGNATTSLEKHTHLTHRSRINSSITGHEFFSRLTHFDNFARRVNVFRDATIRRCVVTFQPEERIGSSAKIVPRLCSCALKEFLSPGKLSGLSEIDVAPGGSSLDTL